MADMPLLPLEREGSVVVLARCNSPLIGEDRAAVVIIIYDFIVLEKGSGGGHDHISLHSSGEGKRRWS